MPKAFNVKEELIRIESLPNDVDRSAAYDDLCFDAESFLAEGQKREAIAIFKALSQLDEANDLFQYSRSRAIDSLEELGLRKRTSLQEAAAKFEKDFRELPEQQRYMAIAKSLFRDFGDRRKNAITLALEYVARATTLGALSEKDNRFRLELQRLLQRT